MPMKSESKMVKEKKDKKKKLKQKQKQKQVVKTSVKVNVQSSGGSGGGGSSMPQAIPQPFTDRSGENIKLQSLIEQLARRVPTRIQVPVEAIVSNQMPIQQKFNAPEYNPVNDAKTLNNIFKAPINYDIPIELGNIQTGDLTRELIKRAPPMEAYYGLEPPSPTIEETQIKRKDIGKSRGSYKEKAVKEYISNLPKVEGQIISGESSIESKPVSTFQESMGRRYIKLPEIQRAGEYSLQKPNFEGEEPMGFPSRSNFEKQMAAQEALFGGHS